MVDVRLPYHRGEGQAGSDIQGRLAPSFFERRRQINFFGRLQALVSHQRVGISATIFNVSPTAKQVRLSLRVWPDDELTDDSPLRGI